MKPSSTGLDGLDASLLERARAASRQSIQLTMLAAILVALAVGTAAWRLKKGGQHASDQQVALVDARRKVDDAHKQADEFAEYLEGRRSSVAVGHAPPWIDQVIPEVGFETVRWRYRFRLGLRVPPEHREEIAGVRFQLDPAAYPEHVIEGTGPNFTGFTEVAFCRSNATAVVSFRDGQVSRIGFDWCGLSKWSAGVHYDRTRLGNVSNYAANCIASKALLVFIPEKYLNESDQLRMLRQVYRVDSRWHPVGSREQVVFAARRSLRDPKQVAIVVKCESASVCVDLAAAYFTAAGGMAPELHCGDVPLLDPEEIALPRALEDLSPEGLAPADPVESCYRLAACEVATSGNITEFPVRACLRGTVSQSVLACSKRATCDAVLSCVGQHP